MAQIGNGAHRSSSRQTAGPVPLAETPPRINRRWLLPIQNSDPVDRLGQQAGGRRPFGGRHRELFLIDCGQRSLRENLSIPTYTDGWTGPNAKCLERFILRLRPKSMANCFLDSNCVNSGTTGAIVVGQSIRATARFFNHLLMLPTRLAQ